MLQTVLGREGFRAGMDLYFQRHDGQAVTIEDFLASFADANQTDLSQFKLWYSQAGTPEITANGVYDTQAKIYTLTLAQSCPPTPGQPIKKPMVIPVRFGLVGQNGEDLAYDTASGATITDNVIHLTEAKQTIVFHGVSSRPVPSLLRGFSAPVRLAMDTPPADLLFLMRTDTDPFNRWQAAQTLVVRTLIAGASAASAERSVTVDTKLIDALADVAENDDLEPAFRAQVLLLPSEADIAREIGRDVDPDAIAHARNAVRAAIADRVGNRLIDVAEQIKARGAFTPDAESAGRRALANAALDLAVANGNGAAVERVVRRYYDSDNMTDRSAALGTLVAAARPERVAALEDFHRRYRDDALVLDKWLAFEASAPALETLDRVKALLHHPSFAITNPNRIRALIGTFAGGNQTQFNRADGAGYDFLADFVIDLDKRNPQTAARLLVSFRSWRALESKRRALAEAALRKVAQVPDLSSDTRDIVTRTLA
jgi:aminopeptidase N